MTRTILPVIPRILLLTGPILHLHLVLRPRARPRGPSRHLTLRQVLGPGPVDFAKHAVVVGRVRRRRFGHAEREPSARSALVGVLARMESAQLLVRREFLVGSFLQSGAGTYAATSGAARCACLWRAGSEGGLASETGGR